MPAIRPLTRIEPVALTALAFAPAFHSGLGIAAAAFGVALWWLRRPPGRREQRVAGTLFALALAGLIAGWASSHLPAASEPQIESELRGRYAAYWRSLDAEAVRVAKRLPAEPRDAAGRRAAFVAFARRVPRANGGARTFLLFDPDGELQVWSGRGLLQRVDGSLDLTRRHGFAQAALSATLYCSRPIFASGGRAWHLVVGESFRRDEAPPGEPPIEGWRSGRWRLANDPSGEAPELDFDARVVKSRRVDPDLLRRGAAALIALALAWLAVMRGSTRVLLAGAAIGAKPRPLAVVLVASGAFIAAGLAVNAALPRTLVAGLGVALGGLGWVQARHRGTIRWGWLGAAAAGPVLLALATRLPPASAASAAMLFDGGPELVLRCGAAAFVFGLLSLGRLRSDIWAPPSASWIALALALSGAAAENYPGAAVILLSAAGVVAAASLASRDRATLGALAGVAVVATLIAGGAWVSGERVARIERAAARLPGLAPPEPAELAAVEARVRQSIRQVGREVLLTDGGAAHLPSDLALAIWRRTPLARRDALSSLSVLRIDGASASFAYGLPVDAQGLPDLSPVRWVDLDPPAWVSRRLEGEEEIDFGPRSAFRIRWALVPRPGFGPVAPRVTDLAIALLRGGAAQTALSDLVPGAHVAIFESDRPAVSPWVEGTPEPTPIWWTGRPFSHRVETPEGQARVAAIHRGKVTAALFVADASVVAALERAGTFAAGALLSAALMGLAALLVALPRGAIRDLVRRALRSYSKRLVLVFSLLLLVPLLVLYGLLSHTLASRLAKEQEVAALDAMRSAQRVLGEYVLSLEPGFGVGTALDDRLFEWLARVIHHEINLYWGSDVYASSKRDLFTAGLLPRRMPGQVWERLALAGQPIAQRTARTGTSEYLEIYAPLEVPGVSSQPTRLVLALPLLAQQEEAVAEAARIRRRALLATLALALLLAALGNRFASRFTRPIEAIVEGTRRIADGAPGLGYRPDEVELEALADAIDRMASRIAESRARLQGEKLLVERIVDNVTAAVVGLDRDGHVLLANRLAREWLGASPGELLPGRAAGESAHSGADAVAAAPRSGEAVALRVDRAGTTREWSVVRVPLEGGEPSELLVVEDVTDVVRAQRLDAWAAMARIIAHEIKNPLTPIRLSAEHLREAWARDREHFAAVFERCTGNILAQVEELRRTASEFSLYSEIPRIEPQRRDLRTVVADVVEAYRAAPPPGIELVYEEPSEPLPASCDPRLLGRALRNLIENAIRVSAGGGRVEVRLEQGDGKVVLRVLDEGPGVPPDLIQRVLEPYFSTASGGTGLGLPIARRVAEEHGGRLEVRNRQPRGFEVAITIPST